MTIKLRHILLLLGVALIFISFLFFARAMQVYGFCLLIGFLISGGSFLFILAKSDIDTIKTKTLWTVLLVALGFLQVVSEPMLIHTSFKIYYSQHKEELNELKEYLIAIPGDVHVLEDSIRFDLTDSLGYNERVMKLRDDLNCRYVSKRGKVITVIIWSRIDIVHGIENIPGDNVSDRREKIEDDWYH